jgi:hypothetical protein
MQTWRKKVGLARDAVDWSDNFADAASLLMMPILQIFLAPNPSERGKNVSPPEGRLPIVGDR